MLPDLERLIRLQRLDNATAEAQRTVDAIPSRVAELDAGLAASTATVDDARRRLAAEKSERQTVEKDLAVVQTRLSRFKEQLMAVKTNKEYTAVQHEIATAEAEVLRLEDAILERMLAADDLEAEVEAAQRAEQADRVMVEQERADLEARRAQLERRLMGTSDERTKLAQSVGPEARRLFESIAGQRQGLAVVEARNGHCTVCNVRLRPQMFNQVLLNTELIRCESCMRILYYDPDGQHGRLSGNAG